MSTTVTLGRGSILSPLTNHSLYGASAGDLLHPVYSIEQVEWAVRSVLKRSEISGMPRRSKHGHQIDGHVCAVLFLPCFRRISVKKGVVVAMILPAHASERCSRRNPRWAAPPPRKDPSFAWREWPALLGICRVFRGVGRC